MSKNTLEPWKNIQSKIIHSTPWIEIVEDLCQIENKEFLYTYTRRVDEGPLVIAAELDGSLWMVRQYRHPIKKLVWQFPAEGKLKDESWEEAAQRGLKEELHFQATKLHELGLFYPDPGGLDQKYKAYIATGLIKDDAANVKHNENEIEDLEIAKFSRKEIDTLIDSGEICDNWTLAGLFLYDRFLKNRSIDHY